ncbi:OB-fold protein [Acinetobacter pittii]|uniref:OB-fold protein n=2 Tax=Acinetobacter calcoaceticus/baumannii complex TaxID=909768 RepID=UPI0002D2650D|nr:zinc-ribbon domain-containing protein [Acinetobacter pittii]SSP29838.1 tRNA_anti-like [Acinetobacter pittii]
MTLILCPECKREISDQANTCPHCGFPIEKIRNPFLKTNKTGTTPPPLPDIQNHQSISSINSQEEPSSKNSKLIPKLFNLFLWVVTIGIPLIFFLNINSNTNQSTEITTESNISSASSEAVSNVPKPKYLKTTATRIINTYANNEVKADTIYKDQYIEVTGKVDSIDSDISNNAVIWLSSNNEYEFRKIMANGDNNFIQNATHLDSGQIITLKCLGDGEIAGNPILRECKFI